MTIYELSSPVLDERKSIVDLSMEIGGKYVVYDIRINLITKEIHKLGYLKCAWVDYYENSLCKATDKMARGYDGTSIRLKYIIGIFDDEESAKLFLEMYEY